MSVEIGVFSSPAQRERPMTRREVKRWRTASNTPRTAWYSYVTRSVYTPPARQNQAITSRETTRRHIAKNMLRTA